MLDQDPLVAANTVEPVFGWRLSLQTCTTGLLLPLGMSMSHTAADRLVTWHICTLAPGYFKHKENDQNQTQAAVIDNLERQSGYDFLALYKSLTLALITFPSFRIYIVTLLHRLTMN